MTNNKNTKRALVSSTLALLMCVAMLIGTTFAWFTDTANANVNTIRSGRLGIVLEQYDEEEGWISAENETLDFISEDENILWEPGCTYRLPKLRVRNNEELAVVFKVAITGINGDAELNEAIDWTIDDFAISGTELNLAPNATKEFSIEGHMRKEVGNEYQDKTITGIAIRVDAKQAMAEKDSIDDTYDRYAEYATTASDPTIPTFNVSSASQLQAALTNNVGSPTEMVVNLEQDVQLAEGETWVPLNLSSYIGVTKITINGKNHTIKGLNDALIGACTYGNVEVTINDLTLDGSVVKKTVVDATNAGLGIGAFINEGDHAKSIKFKNCHLKNAEVDFTASRDEYGYKVTGVGGFIGYTSCDLTMENCTVENTKVTANYSSAGAVAGHVSAYAGKITNITNATVKGCTVKGESATKSGYVVGTANSGATTITTSACANNTVFDVSNSDKVYGRLVGGTLTVNGSSVS